LAYYFVPALVVALLLKVVLGEVNAPFTEDFRDSPLTALMHSGTPTLRSFLRDSEARNLGIAAIDPFNPLEMSQVYWGMPSATEDREKSGFAKG
jgi:hypothetical protein